MSAGSLSAADRLAAARNMVIDRFTVAVSQEFADAGIVSLVLKGPALADWLYPGEVRPYSDTDLMISPEDWDGAVEILKGRGLSDELGPLAHPRMESFAGTAFNSATYSIDLHCALHGLKGDRKAVWETLLQRAEPIIVAGEELRAPSRPTLAMHVALHAAHHSQGKPIEDLRRAIAIGDESLWREASQLANRLDGLPAFVSGLRLLEDGETLVNRLRLGPVRSARHELRREGIPLAEALDGLLSDEMGTGERLRVLAREIFPTPEFMRWRSTLARRGRVGLVASYPERWAWLAAKAPRALVAVVKARRSARPSHRRT